MAEAEIESKQFSSEYMLSTTEVYMIYRVHVMRYNQIWARFRILLRINGHRLRLEE